MESLEVEFVIVCPKCKSKELISDMFHAEIYCQDCGLVVMDMSSPRFKDIREKKAVPRELTGYELYLTESS